VPARSLAASPDPDADHVRPYPDHPAQVRLGVSSSKRGVDRAPTPPTAVRATIPIGRATAERLEPTRCRSASAQKSSVERKKLKPNSACLPRIRQRGEHGEYRTGSGTTDRQVAQQFDIAAGEFARTKKQPGFGDSRPMPTEKSITVARRCRYSSRTTEC